LIGTQLGHYRITGHLGAGGMGEVYRARDEKLDRDVAIKLLPAAFDDDPERLARFEREAKLLAQLHHPNIASIFGIEEWNATRALVMELVEGPTLAERLLAGALPVREALAVALEIAEALETAHEKGIVHRDLKPQNVKAPEGGTVKVLDFGLAKAMDPLASGAASASQLAQSPTITFGATAQGVILGTAAYMSPEQARGLPVDKRADIWAFGVVLFEMLVGETAFAAATVPDTLAAVLTRELDWQRLPPSTPAPIRRLLRRCLARDPRERQRDIGDARLVIAEVLAGVDEASLAVAASPTTPAVRTPKPWIAAAGLLAGALAVVTFFSVFRATPTALPLRKFSVELTANGGRTLASHGPAISPDGTALAYVDDGRLWIRELGGLEPRPVDGGDGALNPFWSPDSAWLGFLQDRSFFRVPRGGGTATRMATLPDSVGGQAGGSAGWSADGRIAVGTTFTELLWFPEKGGELKTLRPGEEGELDVHEVATLPDGRGWLMTVHREEGEGFLTAFSSSGERYDLLAVPEDTFTGVTYSPSGHVLFRRVSVAEGIWALPFSLDRMQATGEPFLVGAGGFNPTLANDGTLAYREGEAAPSSELVWLDRAGRALGVVAETQTTMPFPQLSPDGRSVLLCNGPEHERDVWLFDTTTGLERRLTFDKFQEYGAVFSRDGRRVYFWGGTMTTFALDLDGGPSRPVAPALTLEEDPTGRDLVFARRGSGSGFELDLVRRPIDGEEADEEVLVATPGLEWSPQISPDGRFLLYASTESGSEEVYLTTYPRPTQRWEVSRGGGAFPRWRGDGREIFYTTDDAIFAVDVDLAQTPRLGRPQKLFERPTTHWSSSWKDGFDVSADGQRFILLRPRANAPRSRLVVVQNWFAQFAQ